MWAAGMNPFEPLRVFYCFSTNTYVHMRRRAYDHPHSDLEICADLVAPTATTTTSHRTPPMDEMNEVFETVAKYFSLLSEPTRLRIMHTICQDEKSVNQIAEETALTQTNVSRHLGLMYQGGVLSRRRDGSQIYYRVSDESFTEVCRTVCIRVAAELDGGKDVKRGLKEFIKELG
jgi:DNA-binding transcriptional ArsR family regulator